MQGWLNDQPNLPLAFKSAYVTLPVQVRPIQVWPTDQPPCPLYGNLGFHLLNVGSAQGSAGAGRQGGGEEHEQLLPYAEGHRL